ncbi:MAG TPA: thiamine pyrophosphate-dependent enzyme [Streptosporangiaceae bacterium]|jgi:acetolactate synthase-1/2/3 large subunit
MRHASVRTGGRILIDQLTRHAVRQVFCVPGESYLGALDALYDSAIETVVCRQEGGAAYMAEAYGKLTGRPGVCFTTRAPGAANALVGLQTAAEDATPVVLFVGLVPRGHRDRAAFQEFDLRGVFGTVAKLVETIDDAARVPEYVARAFAAACSGRPGPVVLGLPEDMLADVAVTADVDPLPVAEGAVSAEERDRLARLLSAARRPLVVAAGSRWTPAARDDLREWAQRWSLPVAVDFRCQDLVDNDAPVYVGPLGYGRDDRLAARLAGADLVIAVGAALGDVATDGYTLLGGGAAGDDALPGDQAAGGDRPPGDGAPRVVQVLPYADVAGQAYAPLMSVLASPSAFGAAVRDLAPDAPVPWHADTEKARAEHLAYAEPVLDGDELDLGAVFTTLRDRLDRDRDEHDPIITFGAGNHAIWAQRFLRYRRFPAQLGPRNGSMGYGVPAAVAAALTFGNRRVVSVAGDGCFLMNGQELATAMAYGAAPLILVVSNGQYGTIRQHQEREHPGRVSGTALLNPDFAAYARAFGAYGEVVARTEEFPGALDRALSSGTAAVIDLRVSPDRLGPGLTVTDLH